MADKDYGRPNTGPATDGQPSTAEKDSNNDRAKEDTSRRVKDAPMRGVDKATRKTL